VDDASTDETAKIVRDSPVRYPLRNDTERGPAHSRNRGARIASGDILLFVDSRRGRSRARDPEHPGGVRSAPHGVRRVRDLRQKPRSSKGVSSTRTGPSNPFTGRDRNAGSRPGSPFPAAPSKKEVFDAIGGFTRASHMRTRGLRDRPPPPRARVRHLPDGPSRVPCTTTISHTARLVEPCSDAPSCTSAPLRRKRPGYGYLNRRRALHVPADPCLAPRPRRASSPAQALPRLALPAFVSSSCSIEVLGLFWKEKVGFMGCLCSLALPGDPGMAVGFSRGSSFPGSP